MKVLADLHHGDLYMSLQMLFVKRLGWDLYRPIGLDWYEQGFWQVYDHPGTAEQYLGLHQVCPPTGGDGRPITAMFGQGAWVNRCANESNEPGVYTIFNPAGDTKWLPQRGVTLETATEMHFDIVLSSLPAHFPRYERFRDLYCPQAKHIYQIGNSNMPPGAVRNLLNSTGVIAAHVPNQVQYHQEFALSRFPNLPCNHPTSLLNLMHFQAHHYLGEFTALASHPLIARWPIKNYGGENPDGMCEDVPGALVEHGFLWQAKRGGDGYGWNLHNAFAMGRPVLTHFRDYAHELGGRLLVDGETAIDLDGRSTDEVAHLLVAAAADHEAWRSRVTAKFQEVVDFDAEFVQIQKFLERLL